MKIADGAGKLADGGTTLTAGIESLQAGATGLGEGLNSASNQLKTASTESNNAEVLSEPLSLSKTDNDQVPVNGIAYGSLYDICCPLCCCVINKYDFC